MKDEISHEEMAIGNIDCAEIFVYRASENLKLVVAIADVANDKWLGSQAALLRENLMGDIRLMMKMKDRIKCGLPSEVPDGLVEQ